MNRVIAGLAAFFVSFPLCAGKVVLTKDDIHSVPPKVNTVELFKKTAQAKDWVAPMRSAKGTKRVIALRVEFAEDDDPRTTGNGRMDYVGNGEEPIIDIVGMDTLLNPYYDGPHTKAYFEMLLQALRNFYQVNSYGELEIFYKVFPAEDSAAYELPHSMLYYGYPAEMELGLCTLLRDAILAAEEQDTTLEFRSWRAQSTDLLVFHAGSCWQTDIMWDSPYDIASAFIPGAACLYYLNDDSFLGSWDGGTILPEMARQDGVMFGLEGQLIHEFAHNLGHFDLYDVTGNSMGVGSWDLMGYGGWLGDPLLPAGRVPSLNSAYAKCLFGWVDPLVVEGDTTVIVDAAEVDTSEFGDLDDRNFVVKVPINANEYFLIENRQEFAYSDTLYAEMEMGVIVYLDGGQWDYFLPGSGLLIWHVDEGVIYENWPYNTVNAFAPRKGVDLEEADGIQDFDGWVEGSTYEIYGSAYDPFFAAHNDSFTPRTNPSTHDNDGGATGIYMVGIAESGNAMSLTVHRGGEEFLVRESFPTQLGAESDFGTNSVNLWSENGDVVVVAASRDGSVHLVGETIVTVSADDSIFSSPLVFDSTVVVVTRDGTLSSWGLDGLERWPPFSVGEGPFYSSPAAGDIDGDGVMEIVVGSDSRWLYVIEPGAAPTVDGIFLGDVVRTSVAFADLDDDPTDVEIVASSGDSRLFLIDGDGFVLSDTLITEILGPLRTSPVAGDIDSDGVLELVALSQEGNLHCFDLSGNRESYWPSSVGDPGFSSPALGDIDRDGYMEIVLISGRALNALNHNGTTCTGFPVELDEPAPTPYFWFEEDTAFRGGFDELFSSPILVDMEGDGYLEIIFGSGTNLHGYDHRGDPLNGFPLGCGGEVSSTPAAFVVGDTLWVYVASREGMIYCWGIEGNPDAVWPMFRRDASRSGCLATSASPVAPGPALLSRVYSYPNPVNGPNATLRYHLGDHAVVKIEIFDVAGERVAEYEGNTTPNEFNEVSLDVSGLATGLYVYRIEATNSSRSEEFIGKLAVVR